jgi:hypothetical protein
VRGRHWRSEVALIGFFLTAIYAVPLAQILIELRRGERILFTDIFRFKPSAENLRLYERALEDKSWAERALRPLMQRFLFRTFGDAGSEALRGRGGWLFYRPDVRLLLESERADGNDAGRWVEPTSGTPRENVLKAIVRFRDQLSERKVALLVVPAPGKASVYPDMLTDAAEGKEQGMRSPTLELIDRLRAGGVQVLDLFALFREYRRRNPSLGPADLLYLQRDTHWTPLGAQMAARAVADRLRSLGWAPEPSSLYRTGPRRVRRYGDIVEMIRAAGVRELFEPEPVTCVQVADEAFGPIASPSSGRQGTYKHPVEASILVLGDSFCRIYQDREPRSLGESADAPANGGPVPAGGPTRLVPGSSGFPSHLALSLQAPIDYIISDGGAATDVRAQLATNPEIMESKKVVVWEFAERDIRLGKRGWRDVPVPMP